MVIGNAERVGFFPTQPGFGKRNVVADVSFAIGLQTQAKLLPVAARYRAPGIFVEHVAQREVVEAQAQGSNHAVIAPAARKFDLVGRGFLHLIDDVDGAVGRIGLDVGLDGFCIEITQLCQLAGGADHVGTAEELPGTRAQFTYDHTVVGFGIATHEYFFDTCLLAFTDANLKINGVVFYVHLHRNSLKKKIAVVEIKRAYVDAAGVERQVGVECFLVVNIALLDAQHRIQKFVGVFGVAYPGDITKVVAFAFRNLNVDVDGFFVVAIYRVADDIGIAKAQSIVPVDEQLLVFFEIIFDVF